MLPAVGAQAYLRTYPGDEQDHKWQCTALPRWTTRARRKPRVPEKTCLLIAGGYGYEKKGDRERETGMTGRGGEQQALIELSAPPPCFIARRALEHG